MSYWFRQLQLIAKDNPYHDEKGRFSTASSFGSRLINAGKNGGFTFNQSGQTPTAGYSVGMYPEHAAILNIETTNVTDVVNWMTLNKSLLTQSDNYAGGWVNDGKLYLDVVKVFAPDQKEQAIQAGKDKNQIAIADMAAIHRGDWDNAFINTGGTGDVAKKDNIKKDQKATPTKPKFALLPGNCTAQELLAVLGLKLKK